MQKSHLQLNECLTFPVANVHEYAWYQGGAQDHAYTFGGLFTTLTSQVAAAHFVTDVMTLGM